MSKGDIGMILTGADFVEFLFEDGFYEDFGKTKFTIGLSTLGDKFKIIYLRSGQVRLLSPGYKITFPSATMFHDFVTEVLAK